MRTYSFSWNNSSRYSAPQSYIVLQRPQRRSNSTLVSGGTSSNPVCLLRSSSALRDKFPVAQTLMDLSLSMAVCLPCRGISFKRLTCVSFARPKHVSYSAKESVGLNLLRLPGNNTLASSAAHKLTNSNTSQTEGTCRCAAALV